MTADRDETVDGGLTPAGIAWVCLALLLLLGLTVGIGYLRLGRWNVVAAMAIATAKLMLIALYFMHLRFSGKTIWVFAGAGFFWFLVLIGLSLSDYLTRWGPF